VSDRTNKTYLKNNSKTYLKKNSNTTCVYHTKALLFIGFQITHGQLYKYPK